MSLKSVIEALVFASPKPLPAREIMEALRAAGAAADDLEAADYAKAKEADVLAALRD
jgi:chromosome segregation and condensation protein ScpB